jgi:hypothetical protein
MPKFSIPQPSDVMGDKFSRWFIVGCSSLFTALIIAQSLHQGRLAMPPTYDDVGYFNDAASRLQVLYDGGLAQLLKGLMHAPPHAPFSTFGALIGFAIFGIKDWAPAAVNVVWVALILVFVRLVLWDLPRWAFVIIGLSALAWPLSANVITECRPDIFAALLTAMGCVLMFQAPLLQASIRHLAMVAAIFGAALLAKPSISPVTLILYLASLAIGFAVEWLQPHENNFAGKAVKRVALYLAITAAIILPYFAFAWRDVYGYIYAVMVTQRDIWGSHMSAVDSAGYYLWGQGGQAMMGPWLRITLALAAVDGIIRIFTRRRVIGARAIGLFLVFLLAYASVSVPSVKSPYLGAVVPAFFLTF